MVSSFATLASIAILVVILTTAITYVTVVHLQLPLTEVLAAMVVVGILNAILRTAIVSNLQEVRGVSVKHPAYALANGATVEETGFLFAAYLMIGIAQFIILQPRFTLKERTMIVAVTGASNVLFRNLL